MRHWSGDDGAATARRTHTGDVADADPRGQPCEESTIPQLGPSRRPIRNKVPMSSQVSAQRVRRRWRGLLRQLVQEGPSSTFDPRELSGMYAVASICYHGNDESVLS